MPAAPSAFRRFCKGVKRQKKSAEKKFAQNIFESIEYLDKRSYSEAIVKSGMLLF
jgi:hypothetical protein